MDVISTTTNASLDSRPHILIQDLPRNVLSPPKDNKKNETKEDKTDNKQNKH
jgi:hypothetical protein